MSEDVEYVMVSRVLLTPGNLGLYGSRSNVAEIAYYACVGLTLVALVYCARLQGQLERRGMSPEEIHAAATAAAEAARVSMEQAADHEQGALAHALFGASMRDRAEGHAAPSPTSPRHRHAHWHFCRSGLLCCPRPHLAWRCAL